MSWSIQTLREKSRKRYLCTFYHGFSPEYIQGEDPWIEFVQRTVNSLDMLISKCSPSTSRTLFNVQPIFVIVAILGWAAAPKHDIPSHQNKEFANGSCMHGGGGGLRGADLTTSQYLREKTLKTFDSLKMFQAGKTALNVINLNRKKNVHFFYPTPQLCSQHLCLNESQKTCKSWPRLSKSP